MLGSDPQPGANAVVSGRKEREVGGWIAPRFPESKAVKRAVDGKSCLAVHSLQPALRLRCRARKFLHVTACRTAGFAGRLAPRKCAQSSMNDRPVNGSGAA